MRSEAKDRPFITVVIPVHNGLDVLSRCLAAIRASSYSDYECIVVDDCSTDDTPAIAGRFGVQVIALNGDPFGPAFARNQGANAANGDVVFFVDADVVIHPDALTKVAATLARPEISAVFGSYDERPDAGDFVSQYKNLAHHFFHQHGREDGVTFWSGCGAVRRQAFLDVGGFDAERYRRPSIEDIDLGARLRVAGHRILLDKTIQATHLKRWTLKGMTTCDVFDRAIPWTLLTLRDRNVPNDLNLGTSQRLSALLLCLMVCDLVLAAVFLNLGMILLPLLGLSLLVVGYWRWREGLPPAMSWRAELVTYALLGLVVGIAVYTDKLTTLPFIAPVALGMLLSHWAVRLHLRHSRAFFDIVVVGLAACFILALSAFPAFLVAPLVVGLLLILALNRDFYVFFARKRGVFFAAAVIPFHLLYYFYSVVAFVFATGWYLWNMRGLRGRPALPAS